MATTMELESLVVRLSMDGTSYLAMLGKATTATQSFGEAVVESVRSAGDAFNALTKYIALPVSLLEGASIKAFASFNLAMTQSTSVMSNLSDEQQTAMEELAKSLSTKGVHSATEMGKAYYYLASAGLDANQAMAVLPALQNFATAGAFDLEKATTFAADAQAALGLKVKDAAQNMENMVRITDVLVKANVLSNANVEQFSIALTHQAGAALRSFHKSVEEGVAVLAAFADQGIKAELAGNTLSRMYRILAQSAVKHADEHARLGLRVFDASGKMRNSADIIQNLEDVLRPMSDQMRTAELTALGFEIRLQQAILPLLGTSKQIRQFEKDLKGAGGETERVSNKQMMAFANQMKMVWNTVNVAAIEIGGKLAPVMLMLAKGLEGVVTWFRKLDENTVVFGLVAVSTTAALVTFFAVLIGGFLVLNIVTGGMPIIMGFLLAGIVAVSVAFAEFVQKMGGIKPTLVYLKELGAKAWEWVKPILIALGDFFRVLWFVVRQTFDKFLEWSIKTWDEMTGGARTSWKEVQDFIIKAIIGAEWVLLNFKDTAELVWAGIKYYAIAALNFILKHIFDILSGSDMIAIWGAHTLGWHNMFDIVITYFNMTWAIILEAATGNVKAMWRILTGAASGGQVKTDTLGEIEFKLGGISLKDLKNLEAKLKTEYEKLGAKAAISFDEFYKNKLKELAETEGPFKAIANAIKAATKFARENFTLDGLGIGSSLGKGMTKGLQTELHKFDAALYGSLEFLDRLDTYRATILGENEGGGRMAGLGRFGGHGGDAKPRAAAQVGSVEDLDRKNKNTDKILADIRDILYDGSRKKSLTIEGADLIV